MNPAQLQNYRRIINNSGPNYGFSNRNGNCTLHSVIYALYSCVPIRNLVISSRREKAVIKHLKDVFKRIQNNRRVNTGIMDLSIDIGFPSPENYRFSGKSIVWSYEQLLQCLDMDSVFRLTQICVISEVKCQNRAHNVHVDRNTEEYFIPYIELSHFMDLQRSLDEYFEGISATGIVEIGQCKTCHADVRADAQYVLNEGVPTLLAIKNGSSNRSRHNNLPLRLTIKQRHFWHETQATDVQFGLVVVGQCNGSHARSCKVSSESFSQDDTITFDLWSNSEKVGEVASVNGRISIKDSKVAFYHRL